MAPRMHGYGYSPSFFKFAKTPLCVWRRGASNTTSTTTSSRGFAARSRKNSGIMAQLASRHSSTSASSECAAHSHLSVDICMPWPTHTSHTVPQAQAPELHAQMCVGGATACSASPSGAVPGMTDGMHARAVASAPPLLRAQAAMHCHVGHGPAQVQGACRPMCSTPRPPGCKHFPRTAHMWPRCLQVHVCVCVRARVRVRAVACVQPPPHVLPRVLPAQGRGGGAARGLQPSAVPRGPVGQLPRAVEDLGAGAAGQLCDGAAAPAHSFR